MRLRLFVAALLLLIAVLPVAVPWLKTPFLLALSNGLAVLGVTVLIRAGQVSFGNAMFACLAGYGATYAARWWHLDALLLIVVGTVLAALAGALVGLFMVRYRGIFFGMLNLAFSMMLFAVLGKFGAFTGGTCGEARAHAWARSSSRARSRALRVREAARSSSARASSKRPSFASRSPRTLGKRW